MESSSGLVNRKEGSAVRTKSDMRDEHELLYPDPADTDGCLVA